MAITERANKRVTVAGLVLAVTLVLVLARSSAVLAVLNSVTVIEQDGHVWANGIFRIQDMETKEFVGKTYTDDDGVLRFDFPQRGKTYGIVHETKLVLTHKASLFSRAEKLGMGFAAGGLGVLAIASSSGGSAGTTTTPTETGAAPSPEPSPANVPAPSQLNGTFTQTGNKIIDTCDRIPADVISNQVEVNTVGSTTTFYDYITMTGSYDETSGAVRVVGELPDGLRQSFSGDAVLNGDGSIVVTGRIIFFDTTDNCEWQYDASYRK